jgi:chromate transport protein ChrA
VSNPSPARPVERTGTTAPLAAFVRATSFHIGAAAAAAALRHDLVKDHRLEAHDIDAAYAVSRITPGTNMLALYAVLGRRLGGWSLAVQAVGVGALVPAVIVVMIGFLYVEYSTAVAVLMKGARAGGVAVLLGGAVRLLKPQMVENAGRATVCAIAAFIAAWFLPVSPFIVLLLAGAGGALWLRPPS